MGACVGTLVLLAGIWIAVAVVRARARAAAIAARLADLTRRFGADAAAAIVAHRFWQGMTVEMLGESMGHPAEVDEFVLKSKVRHVFKYGRLQRDRFATKVTAENGVVVGWETK